MTKSVTKFESRASTTQTGTFFVAKLAEVPAEVERQKGVSEFSLFLVLPEIRLSSVNSLFDASSESLAEARRTKYRAGSPCHKRRYFDTITANIHAN